MEIIRTVKELKAYVSEAKKQGNIGFVPTMGALHQGHISLVERCKGENSTTVVSVFVNPTQFNDKNDLAAYPRTEEADAKLLETAGCDIMFCPTPQEVYPQEDTRQFNFGTLESVMEGEQRPGHFNGVAQVVSRLFEMVAPTKAYFGEKDFQQLAIIRKMVADLGLDVQIVGCPIVRADDGLALSSRNVLLTPEQRSQAPVIFKTISYAEKIAEMCGIEYAQKWVKEQIECGDDMEVEYFSIVDSATLQPLTEWAKSQEKRGCIAVKVGKIRLIDNIAL